MWKTINKSIVFFLSILVVFGLSVPLSAQTTGNYGIGRFTIESNKGPISKTINGQEISEEHFQANSNLQYIAAVGYTDISPFPNCNGSLILDGTEILTAKHCLKTLLRLKNLEVRIACYNLNSDSCETISVESVMFHIDEDLVRLKLAKKSLNGTPINPWPRDLKTGTKPKYHVNLYGRDYDNNRVLPVQTVEMLPAMCTINFPQYSCYKPREISVYLYNGDSGGGLIASIKDEDYLVGVVSTYTYNPRYKKVDICMPESTTMNFIPGTVVEDFISQPYIGTKGPYVTNPFTGYCIVTVRPDTIAKRKAARSKFWNSWLSGPSVFSFFS